MSAEQSIDHTITNSIQPQSLVDSLNLSQRYHYMDNLRALAMLLGIFFHASLAYSPMMSQLWLAADGQHSVVVDFVAFFSHLFRMPLFFVVAGFFTFMLFEKRGIGATLKNRGLRITLPFVIFVPMVVIGVISVIHWAVNNVEQQPAMLKVIGSMMNNPDAPQPPFSTMHLWFLFNLSWFYLIAALVYRFKLHQSRPVKKLMQPQWLVTILPLLMVPALLSQAVPHPAAERIYPELWSLGYYGVFFLFGLMLFHYQALIDQLAKYATALLLFSVIGYCVFYSTLPAVVSLEDAMKSMTTGMELTPTHGLQVVLECYIGVTMTLWCIVMGKKWLDSESKTLRYFADSSYWVYILHMPLVFLIQYLLIDIDINMWLKFLLCSFGTLAIGMLSYALLVRATPIGTLLNGKRKPMFKS